MRYVVGIDIGGTNIVAGTVAEDGSELLGLVSEPTFSEQGADAVLTRIVKLTRASMAAARGKEIAGVGIGSPGPLNTKTGVVLLTPNLGWTNFPLRDRLARAMPTAPSSASGGAGRPVAPTMSSASRSARVSAGASCSEVKSTGAHPTSPARSDT